MTSLPRPRALVADDEPLLREELVQRLAELWPALDVVAQARNGREAIALFDAHRPDVCFLDVRMPGLSGVDAARHVAGRAHVVFVTAYDRYAVEAFTQGALDYLVKPVALDRLADTVARLQARLRAAEPALHAEALLLQLAGQLAPQAAKAPLRWVRASVGNTLRLIPVEDIDFLRSEEKYTCVGWRGDGGEPAQALVRLPLKDLLAQLDPALFVQVHRSVVVNLASIRQVVRGDNESASIHLRQRADVLPVSRSYLHHFRQM